MGSADSGTGLSSKSGIGFVSKRPDLISFRTFCGGIPGYQVYYSASASPAAEGVGFGSVEAPSAMILKISSCLSGASSSDCTCYLSFIETHSPSLRHG